MCLMDRLRHKEDHKRDHLVRPILRQESAVSGCGGQPGTKNAGYWLHQNDGVSGLSLHSSPVVVFRRDNSVYNV
jgi:hypothetical protein